MPPDSQTKTRLWRPETNANELILNRAEAEANVNEHLGSYLTALSGMVDYGSHLIPRCWLSSDRSIRDIVVLTVLLKQIVALLDAGTELLRKGCVQPALLQLRAAFEASVYIDWILTSRGKARAKAYYVWNIRRGLRWNKRALRGTAEAAGFRKETKKLSIHSEISKPKTQRAIRKQVKEFESHLALSAYRSWNARFEKRRGKRLYDPDWYEVLFKRKRSVSFYDICRHVHRQAEYRILYEIGSEAMHSSRSDTHVQILEGGRIGIRQLRELTDFGFVCQMFMITVLNIYRRVLQEYRPDEAPSFARKYIENWRKAVLTPIKVTYREKFMDLG